MVNGTLTRRAFIEIAAAAATTATLARGFSAERPGMLPEDAGENARVTVPINRNWRFMRQASQGNAVEAGFIGAEKLGYDDSSWPSVWLPHSWDNTADNPFSTRGHFRGVGWYRTLLDVPIDWRERTVVINFKGVFQVAEVWSNGVHVGEHVGGYTGFCIDLTKQLKFGEQNLIAVKVDDTLSRFIAPAIETNVAVYGGIYRTVSLTVLHPIHIAENGMWVTWRKSGKDAVVTVNTTLRSRSSSSADLTVEYQIVDVDGAARGKAQAKATVNSGEDAVLGPTEIQVPDPRLWSPENPHLYRLLATVRNSEGIVDSYSINFGIRYMGHDAKRGFILNGEPINLHGVNRRQDYGFLGDAVPEAIAVKDVRQMKDMGVNFIRTAHYPQDPAVLDACDALGILVWEEIPDIKLIVYPPANDQVSEGVYATRFSRPFMANLKAQLKEMVEQNRNHPSVIIWGLGDDLSQYQYPEDFVELCDATHALDPTRWTAGRVPHVTDVVDATVLRNLPEEQRAHPERMYIWNEWGSFQSERGKEGSALIRKGQIPFLSDSEAAVFCEGFLMQWNAMPWLGTLRWCMYDCSEPGSSPTASLWDENIPGRIKPRWPVDDYYGCADMWRLPKNSFYLMQSQWTETPMIHIVGHWTWPEDTGKPRQVRVYSNCDSVELFLNGKSLGSHAPATPERIWEDFQKLVSKYSGIEDMIDQLSKDRLPGALLHHSPFVWDNVAYQPGTLTAIGRKDGTILNDELRTAGSPAKLFLIPDKRELLADAMDVAFVQAQVLDVEGTLVPTAQPWIAFSVQGPARLLGGTTEIDAISGIAAINLQSTGEKGRVTIRAEAHGLAPFSIDIGTAS